MVQREIGWRDMCSFRRVNDAADRKKKLGGQLADSIAATKGPSWICSIIPLNWGPVAWR